MDSEEEIEVVSEEEEVEAVVEEEEDLIEVHLKMLFQLQLILILLKD